MLHWCHDKSYKTETILQENILEGHRHCQFCLLSLTDFGAQLLGTGRTYKVKTNITA